jgi:ribosomal-protein-alanine N-acetyltransferase
MKLRPLGPDDAPRLAELEKAAFVHPWSADQLAAELAKEGAVALGLDDGECLAAAILCATVLDEAELLRVATRPGCRRQGLGERLLDEAVAELRRRGIASLFLEVEENNLPAIRLYEKSDFERVGRRPAYYPSGAAALLYRRALPQMLPALTSSQ